MSDSIGELKVKVSLEVETAEAKAEVKAAAEDARNAWERAADSMKGSMASSMGITTDQLDTGLEHIRNFGLVAAGAVAAVGVALVNMAGDIDRQARSLGVSVTEFQRLQYAAEAAGVETNDMLGAVGQLQQKAATDGGGDLFRQLGISATDANGQIRSANDLMLEAADALGRMGPGSEQTAAAIQLFGDAGRKLVPVLGQGREAMQGLFNEFDALGGGVTEDAARKSREMEHELNKLKLGFISAAQPIIEAVVPALTKMVEFIRPVIADSHNMKVALAGVTVALGAAAVAAMALNLAMLPIIGAVALGAAGIASLVLLVDDFIVTLQGGDSVLKRMIDSIFGLGATRQTLTAMSDLARAFGEQWDIVVGTIEELGVMLGELWDKVPQPLKDFLAAPARALGGLLPSFGGGDDGAPAEVSPARQAAIQEEFAALMRQTLPLGVGGSGAASAVSPTAGQAARAAATNQTARGGSRTVNASARADVRIQGIVDPEALQRAVGPIIERTLAERDAEALANITETAGG